MENKKRQTVRFEKEASALKKNLEKRKKQENELKNKRTKQTTEIDEEKE